MKFTRLSHQILAVFVAVVILALGLSGWAVTTLAQRVVADNVVRGHQELARRIAEEVDLEMKNIRPILSLLAESATVRTMHPAGVATELARYQARFPALTAAYVADLAGQQIARTDGQPLENVATTYGFQVAREGHELLSDVYLPRGGGGPMLTFYLPVAEEGEQVGVLVADVNFARVQAILEGLALTRNETAVVFAQNGRAVAHSRVAELAEPPALTDPALIETLVRGSAGVLEDYTDELGRTVVGVHAPVSELGWGVVIQTPEGELAAEVAALRRTMAMGLLGGVALAVVAGWLMANRLARPVNRLVQATERVEAGDLSVSVDVTTSNEIGRLADAFNQMVVSIQQAQDALRWERDLAGALEQAAAALTATLDFERVLDRILEQVSRVVPNDASNIMLIRGDEVHVVRWRGYERFGAEAYISTVVFPIPKVPSFQQMLASREPIVISNTTSHPGWLHVPAMEWLRSYAALPIIVRDEVIGFLSVDSATPNFFTQAHLEPLRAFADHTAAAIENARLYEQVQHHAVELEARIAAATGEIRQRADELATLYEVGRDLAATLDLEVLLPAIAQRLTDTLGADRCAVFLFDEGVGLLRARAAHGYMAERLADFGYRPGEEIVGPAYTTGESQYVPDLDLVPDLPRRDEIRAVLAVPLASPTAGPVGVLSVSSLRPEAFTPDQQRLLETLAGQIARAIENARLYRAAGESVRRALGLYQIGAAVSSTLDLDAILQTVVERSRELLNANFGEMHLLDAPGGNVRRTLFSRLPRGRCPVREKPTLRGLNGEVLRTGRPVRFADRQEFPGTVPLPTGHPPIGPFLGAPIMGNDGPIADILLARRPGREPFTAQDEETLVTVANQAAMAIENARLYEATQEANRLKSQFLANMSHELRTPLNSIIGYTKLMLDGLEGPINEEQREDLRIVYTNSKHLLQLINDLLDLSRIEAGKIVLSYQTFTISELLAEVIPGIEQLVREKGIALVTSVDPSIDYLYADKGKTRQVLINILGNAVKFTNEGSIELNVAETDTDFVFSATDTGIGIKKEHLEVIFDRFEQVGPAQIAGYEGTGLGLTISKQFVEMQGGRIWAESEPGKGSTFSFTLPKKRVANS